MVEEGHLATQTVEKDHHEESGSNPPTVPAQKRREFMSICRRAAQAKVINHHIYILTDVPIGVGATTGARSDSGTTTPGKA